MSGARSVEEIEAEITRTRLAMQSTVDELSYRIDPRAQVADLKDRGLAYCETLKEAACESFEKAKAGSLKDMGILAGAATAAVMGLALLFKRR